jgi:hypothetical protein
MKSTNTFGIHFIIRVPGKSRNTEAGIYARVTVNGRRTEISLKRKIDPKAWDDVKGRAKGKREEIIKLNNHLERVRSMIAEGYHNLVQQRKPVTVDTVKSLFLGCDEEIMTLVKLMDYHSEQSVHRLAPGRLTAKHAVMSASLLRIQFSSTANSGNFFSRVVALAVFLIASPF